MELLFQTFVQIIHVPTVELVSGQEKNDEIILAPVLQILQDETVQ